MLYFSGLGYFTPSLTYKLLQAPQFSLDAVMLNERVSKRAVTVHWTHMNQIGPDRIEPKALRCPFHMSCVAKLEPNVHHDCIYQNSKMCNHEHTMQGIHPEWLRYKTVIYTTLDTIPNTQHWYAYESSRFAFSEVRFGSTMTTNSEHELDERCKLVQPFFRLLKF